MPPRENAEPDRDQVAGDAADQRAEGSALVTRTRQRHEAVQALRAQDESLNAISRELGLAAPSGRFAGTSSVDELLAKPRAGRPSILDDCIDYLHHRFNEGCASATDLCGEIRALGYQGSVHSYLRPRRSAPR